MNIGGTVMIKSTYDKWNIEIRRKIFKGRDNEVRAVRIKILTGY